jgi:hypothetical protein
VRLQEFTTRSRAKWILGLAVLVAVMATMLIGPRPPIWMLALLGSMALALLYIVARLRSRYDPLDPRFGSCIPPITMSSAADTKLPLAQPDIAQRQSES